MPAQLDPGTRYEWTVTVKDSRGLTATRSSWLRIAMLPTATEMVSTSTGDAYWQVASDGGVFSFASAKFVVRLSSRARHGTLGAMAHPIVSTPRMEAAMEHIRPVALALAGVVERSSHGSPTFFTAEGRKGRTFASVHDEREWYEGRLCLWAAGPKELQEALVSGGLERFFVPPYVGHRGWVGLRLDLPEVDWDEVAGVIEDAHGYVLDR